MDNTKSKQLIRNIELSKDAKIILASMDKVKADIIESHKKTNTALVVSIDGKIVHIKPEDL
ncbi:MAG: hypothetical protein KA534_04115 [Sediminibacterium sp.]|nr:hypothetical protein [Sediminibacterium sp.]